MSKIAEAYHDAKWAALTGLGYLALRSPKRAALVGWALTRHYVMTIFRDAGAAGRILWKDLAKPVLAQDVAILRAATNAEYANILARGSVFSGTMLLTTGGALAQHIDTALEFLGIPPIGEEPGDLVY